MPIDREEKLNELTSHLASIAALSVQLKDDRVGKKSGQLATTDDGWTLPGEEYDELHLVDSPVSDEELVAWLEKKDEAIREVKNREALRKFVKVVADSAVQLAPILIQQYQAKKAQERLEEELERRRREEEHEGEG